MPGFDQVGVIGATTWPRIVGNRGSLEEILYDLVQSTLADASVAIDDVDGIVVASNDQYDGRAISVMAASGSVGGVDRDILSTPSAGEHAFVLGALRVASELYRTQLVASWSPLETETLHEVQRLAADPYFHRRLPLDELSSHALQASVLEAKPGVREAAAVLAATRRAADPQDNAGRWPLAADMARAPTQGAVALMLASRTFIEERGIRDVAWLDGLGWATESSFLGDRDLSVLESLQAAATKAYTAAALDDPSTQLDVIDVASETPHQILLALEGLGLSSNRNWLRDIKSNRFGEGQRPFLRRSPADARPTFCAGLCSIADIANLIRKGSASRGLAHAASGFAMQYNTVAILRGAEAHQ